MVSVGYKPELETCSNVAFGEPLLGLCTSPPEAWRLLRALSDKVSANRLALDAIPVSSSRTSRNISTSGGWGGTRRGLQDIDLRGTDFTG